MKDYGCDPWRSHRFLKKKVSRIKHARCESLEMTGEKSECVIVAKKLGDEEVW